MKKLYIKAFAQWLKDNKDKVVGWVGVPGQEDPILKYCTLNDINVPSTAWVKKYRKQCSYEHFEGISGRTYGSDELIRLYCIVGVIELGTDIPQDEQESVIEEPTQESPTVEQYDNDEWFAAKCVATMNEVQANRIAHARAYGFTPQEGDVCVNSPYAQYNNYQSFDLFRYEGGQWTYHTTLQVGIDRYLSSQGYHVAVKFGKYAEGYYSQHTPQQTQDKQEQVTTVEASDEAQPGEQVITPEQIERYAEQCYIKRQEAHSKRLASLKAQAKQEGMDWARVIFHAVPSAMREKAYHDGSIKPYHLDFIAKWLVLPKCHNCQRHTPKCCPRCEKPLCTYCEWGTLDPRLKACQECALFIRKQQEESDRIGEFEIACEAEYQDSLMKEAVEALGKE